MRSDLCDMNCPPECEGDRDERHADTPTDAVTCTAWLTTDQTCLPGNGEIADVSVMDPVEGSTPLVILPINAELFVAHGYDLELAANAVLEAAGWLVPGNDHDWESTSTGGTREVEWRGAGDPPASL